MQAFGFAGWSGSGKTTLVEKLLPHLVAQRLKVSVIKHAHHRFDVDRPGKDSWRHRQAGAHQVLISSDQRWALIHELRGDAEPSLAQQLGRLDPCDLVLIEGYKRAPIAKLEVVHSGLGAPLLCGDDPRIVALAGDRLSDPVHQKLTELGLPWFDWNDVPAIAHFIVQHLNIHVPPRSA